MIPYLLLFYIIGDNMEQENKLEDEEWEFEEVKITEKDFKRMAIDFKLTGKSPSTKIYKRVKKTEK